MHRSGTSLVASLLHALSVRLGEHLVPGDINNQPGYFEDLKFNRFHKRVLSQCCVADDPGHSDWGWTESERLDTSRFSSFREQAQRLLIASNHKAGPWGWKDPRTTLFLDFWESLVEGARFLLVYRFPWDVADSMQRLEAGVFLRNPDYAYRIWKFYNSRLRDFYVEHSDRCLLVSVNALKRNLETFVSLLTEKLGLPLLESPLEEIFKEHLFKTIDGDDPLIGLVSAAYPDCAELLSELDELADISSHGLWQARPVRSRLSIADGDPVDLSIIIPCYEQGTLLLEAVASAERHAPARCELIIINDGSRQAKTLEILGLLKRSGYRVIDQENSGLSVARNKAIDLARGRYILPLDDDNRIREGLITEAISVLDSSPGVGVVYGDRYDFGGRSGIQQIPDFDLDKLLEGNYIDACAVFRKQVWIDCQGYDLFMSNATDWELWIHAAEAGWRFHHIPQLTFDYRVRPNSMVSHVDAAKNASLQKMVRVKHPELYWAKAQRELAQSKRVLTGEKDQHNRLKAEFATLRSQLEIAKAQADEMNQKLAAKDEEILAGEVRQNQWQDAHDMIESQLEISRAQIAEMNHELVAKDYQLAAKDEEVFARDERIERMANSFGWRMLSRYGRIKHKYLLPVYRLLGHVSR
jgi:hypothetical protein